MTTIPDLIPALQRGASNVVVPAKAAIQMLSDHGAWLARADFHAAITTDVRSGLAYAWIDWDKAISIADAHDAPEADTALLRLACTLAGHLPPSPDRQWTLLEIATQLGDNADLAVTAFAWAVSGSRT